MKRYIQLVTVGVAISIVGVFTGCGQSYSRTSTVIQSASKPVSHFGFSADALALRGVQGKLPVFGGTISRLTSRIIPSKLPSALPNGYQAHVQFTSKTSSIPCIAK